MHSGRVSKLLVLLLLVSMLAGCGSRDTERDIGAAGVSGSKSDRFQIGFSIASFQEERWLVDRDIFIAKCNELGADVILQSANGNAERQSEQCLKLLNQGIDVLVIIAQDGEKMVSVVNEANRLGVPVLAYDRLILNCNIDAYVSYDNVRIGEMQAEYLVGKVPRGNYILLGGADTDYCSIQVKKGQMNILKPFVEKGAIKIVEEQWVKDWNPSVAKKIVEEALSDNKDNIQAIVASNDGTAGGAIQALAERKLAGKVVVSGQDADLAGCQRIAEGTQSMTVYVPVNAEAESAAEVAVKLARKEKFTGNNGVDNGKINVPTLMLKPISVDKHNMMDTVIKDDYQTFEEVYKNIPEARRPPRR